MVGFLHKSPVLPRPVGEDWALGPLLPARLQVRGFGRTGTPKLTTFAIRFATLKLIVP